jgi:hypothetical protein
MMSQSRRLRVLVVHDTEFDEESEIEVLGTEDLALFSLDLGNGYLTRVVSNWPDVIQLIEKLTSRANGDSCSEPPDLLLVDCHFKDDDTSPRLPLLVSGDESVDARGLLYGAILAAYFLGAHPRQPFAFVPYSEDMTAAAGDAYAQTFYSLLSAMLDSVPEIIESEYYSTAMEATPNSQTPAGVVAAALRRYRAELLDAFPEYLYPETSTFEKALTAVDEFLEGGRSLAPDLSLEWVTGKGKKDSVLLSSLFADCRDGGSWVKSAEERREEMIWGSIQEAGMQEFLRSVVDCKNYGKEILEPTKEILRAIKSGGKYKWGRGRPAMQRRILALSVAWALDRCEVNYRSQSKRNSQQLKEYGLMQDDLGLDSTQINRAFREVFGSTVTHGSEFVEILDRSSEWPFPELAWLRALIVRYLKDIWEAEKRPSLDPKHWPKSLKE